MIISSICVLSLITHTPRCRLTCHERCLMTTLLHNLQHNFWVYDYLWQWQRLKYSAKGFYGAHCTCVGKVPKGCRWGNKTDLVQENNIYMKSVRSSCVL